MASKAHFLPSLSADTYPMREWTIRFTNKDLPCAFSNSTHTGAKLVLTLPLADKKSFSVKSLKLEPGDPSTWYQLVEQLPDELTFRTVAQRMQSVIVTVFLSEDSLHAVRGDSKVGLKAASINTIVHQNFALQVTLGNCGTITAEEFPFTVQEVATLSTPLESQTK